MTPAPTTRVRCFVCFRPVAPHRRSLDEDREPSTCSAACEVRNLRNRGAVQVIRNARDRAGAPVVPTPTSPPCEWCKAPLAPPRTRFCSYRCKNAWWYEQSRQVDRELKMVEAHPNDGGTFDPALVASIIARGPARPDRVCTHQRGFALDVCRGCLLGRREIEAIDKARAAL